jgi:hypothetical protein
MREKGVFIVDLKELEDFANHLKWAAEDLNECYVQVKLHAADCQSHWRDDSSERFMQLLENEQKVIHEITNNFNKFEAVVRRRVELGIGYNEIGQKF